MSRINEIQNAILELEGGAYHNLLDSYLYVKYEYDNIQSRGIQLGTNKSVKGVPDSFVSHNDGTYTLIMYGTTQKDSFSKIRDDILQCLDVKKTDLPVENIREIVCCYTTTNISPGQKLELQKIFSNIRLIGIGELALDLLYRYQHIANTMLGIVLDSNQIHTIKEFVRRHYETPNSTRFSENLIGRDVELKNIVAKLDSFNVVLIKGEPGVGKTNFALEVVKTFAKSNGYTVKCILSNGLPIYDDIFVHFRDNKNTIILIDDANALTQLKHLIRLTTDSTRKTKTKIVLTVRDYTSKKIENDVGIQADFFAHELDKLNKDDIRKIITERFTINSQYLINRILSIASGNIRLAIMAGDAFKNEEYYKLDNAFDIYRKYYKDIIGILNQEQLLVATIIAVFKVIELNNEILGQEIRENFGIDQNMFQDYCYVLNEWEVIDIHDDLAVSFSNESLGNYLIYHVIFESKLISMSDLISSLFPNYRQRLVYVFNTVANLFPTPENTSYMATETKKFFDKKIKDEDLRLKFMESFRGLIPLEGLQFIKDGILNLKKQKVFLYKYNFSSINSNVINSHLISMLGVYKYSDYLIESIQILLLHLDYVNSEDYINKSYFSDTYDVAKETAQDIFVFLKNNWCIDPISHKYNYERELVIVNYLSDLFESTKDTSIGIILVWLCKIYLKLEFENVEANGLKGITFSKFRLIESDRLLELRTKCITILGELYFVNELKVHVVNALLDYNPILGDNEINKEIITNDYDAFHTVVNNITNVLNFDECIICYNFYKKFTKIGFVSQKYRNFEENELFVMYLTVSMSFYDTFYFGASIEYKEFQDFKRNKINDLILFNDVGVFTDLLKFVLTKRHINPNWSFSEGIQLFIKEIRNLNIKLTMGFFDQIFRLENFDHTLMLIIDLMEDHLGFEVSHDYFKRNTLPNGQTLNTRLILSSPNSSKKEKLSAIIENISLSGDIILSVDRIYELCEDDAAVMLEYIDKLETINLKHPNTIKEFLRPLQSGEMKIDKFYKMINSGSDLNKFEKLYLKALDDDKYFDYQNTIIKFLIERDEEFIIEFIDYTVWKNKSTMFQKLEVIWGLSNYDRLATSILEKVNNKLKSGNNLIFFWNIDTFFIDCINCTKWLSLYIEKNHNQENLMKTLFILINNISLDRKKPLIINYLKFNRNFQQFKELNILAYTKSWNGSEVPGLESEIIFLESIIDSLSGIDYIDHKLYLDKLVCGLKSRVQTVLYKERIESLN